MPKFGLPEIGGFAFGLVLSAILELLKYFGIADEKTAPWVAVILGVIWGGVHVAVTYWPQALPYWTVIIQVILAVASLPIGAKAGYKGIVQPLARNRWNSEQ